jgi:dCMP deaminase
MNIYAEKGTKIIYTGKNGTDYDKKYADTHLIVGVTYIVKKINVHNWSSTVELEELPGYEFNTVHFEEFNEIETTTKTDWDQRFIDLAEYIGNWSKDRSTKVGAVIVDEDKRVVSLGYNGMPVGFNDNIDSRHERPQKYAYFEHAERNSIYTAARNGSHVKGCTMYLKWFPCVDCARAIIQSGIKRVVCTKPDFEDKRWGDSFKLSYELLSECGVELTYKS